MLIKILKSAFEKPPEDIAEEANPFPGAGERSVVVVVHGASRSDPFKNLAHMLTSQYSAKGLHCHIIDMFNQPRPYPGLEAMFQRNQVRYGIGWGGIGADLGLPADGQEVNAWMATNTPFFKMIGDHPAYFLDVNVSPASNFVNVYGFAEHRDFFVRHLNPRGYAAMNPVTALEPLDAAAIDFRAKQGGPVVFLKNGNDPEGLRRAWKLRASASVARALSEMGEDLLATIATEREWRIEKTVVDYFLGRGIDISAKLEFLAFYIAQLDDLLRRVKSRMIAESLLDFPIEVHGESWEYLDFTGKKAKLVPYGNYARSTQLITEALCVLDMAPNTRSQPHERFIRCASRHTLCLTNQIDILEQDYGARGQPLFDFTPDSIRSHVSTVLENPARHVEIGRAVGAEFERRNSRTALVDFLEMWADQMALMSGDDPQIQGFLVWPPKKFL